MDRQEAQRRKRELEREQEQQKREMKKLMRNARAEGRRLSGGPLPPPRPTEVEVERASTPAPAIQAPISAPPPAIPDYAIKISLGTSVTVAHIPAYTRKGTLLIDPAVENKAAEIPTESKEDLPA